MSGILGSWWAYNWCGFELYRLVDMMGIEPNKMLERREVFGADYLCLYEAADNEEETFGGGHRL